MDAKQQDRFMTELISQETKEAITELSDVINDSGLLQNIENSWELNSLKEGKLGVCAQKCGTEFDPFGEQFI